jgi:hypothetical protein
MSQSATAVGRVLYLNAAAEGNVVVEQQAGADAGDQQPAIIGELTGTDDVAADKKKRRKKRGKKLRKKRRARDSSQRQRQSPHWLRNSQLAAHFGVTVMTVWRWKHDPKLKFPPGRFVNGIEYNNRNKADAWMRAQPVRRGRPSKAHNTNRTEEPMAATI